jgi:hypothetical protein
VEEPDESPIFSKDPEFLKGYHVRYFFCDSMRMAISGVEALELDQLMELDLEVHHHGVSQPVLSLSTMADSLPGLGIVAAVLGVVITMGALGGRRKISVTKSPRLWLELSLVSCSATGLSVRSRPTWLKPRTKNAPTSMFCAC